MPTIADCLVGGGVFDIHGYISRVRQWAWLQSVLAWHSPCVILVYVEKVFVHFSSFCIYFKPRLHRGSPAF